MNLLLANMPINFNSRENLEPPLGICYMASVLKDIDGVNIVLKDYEIEHFSEESVMKMIKELNIDVIGVSFRTASYRSAKKFVLAAKSSGRDLFIGGGGHHATAFAEETLMDLGCDAVIRGEGEYAMRDLVLSLMEKTGLNGVSGISFIDKKTGKPVHNDPRPPIQDINALPWPDRAIIDISGYNVMTILTSRGCPFNCIYCDKGVSTRNVKFRSPDDIFEEIKHCVRDLGKNRLYIVDEHFFLNRKIIEPVLDRIISEKLRFTWTCQARVDGISEEVLGKAKKAGCEQIMFGIETGDETELKYIRKSSSLEKAEEAVRLTKKAGIKARANFMLGFPVSTRQTMSNTVRFAKKMMPDIVRFFAVSPLPNTDLWDDIYGKGNIPKGIKWEELDFFSPSFDLKDMERSEMSVFVSAAYWHVLKKEFLLETTLFMLPNILKLLFYIAATGKVRGNISKCFPRSVNLILDNMHQIKGKRPKDIIPFLKQVARIERTFQA